MYSRDYKVARGRCDESYGSIMFLSMRESAASMAAFVAHVRGLEGEGAAEAFCDRLFRAFGHEGYAEAGATRRANIRSRMRKPPAFVLALNRACAAREAEGKPIVRPGLPNGVGKAGVSTRDAIDAPVL
jgi:hypothetical protein